MIDHGPGLSRSNNGGGVPATSRASRTGAGEAGWARLADLRRLLRGDGRRTALAHHTRWWPTAPVRMPDQRGAGIDARARRRGRSGPAPIIVANLPPAVTPSTRRATGGAPPTAPGAGCPTSCSSTSDSRRFRLEVITALRQLGQIPIIKCLLGAWRERTRSPRSTRAPTTTSRQAVRHRGADRPAARRRADTSRAAARRRPDGDDALHDRSPRPRRLDGCRRADPPDPHRVGDAGASEPASWTVGDDTELLRAVWGAEYTKETNDLRVHMTHLRKKIEPEPSHPRYVLTESGVGYRFVPDTNVTTSD